MSDNAKWYVAHTYSGYENKVAATIEKAVENRPDLQEFFFDIKVPVEMVTEISGDKKKTVEHKVYPGYVFVKMIMNDDSWHVVRNTRGVTGFVGPGSRPVALTEPEVYSLGVEKHEIVVDYREGDHVKITDGPLENFIGLVEEIAPEKNRVRVVVSMFGRETPVELELNQVVPVVEG